MANRSYGKCQAKNCRQWATTYFWEWARLFNVRVYVCRRHFDEWAALKGK